DALVAAARERLDEALEEGRLGEAERDEMVERIRERVDALVQDELPGRAPHGRWGDRESNG
ncbi:MAG: hypothetical protein ACRDNA_11905, partial [Gaiellaceae bacterium]